MSKFCALVAAAGSGTRANLSYPKTLFHIHGKPILIRIIDLISPYDQCPTIIVSPSGKAPVQECLNESEVNAYLVEQIYPRGMGDAVLHFAQSPAFGNAEHVLLVWGDVPFIQSKTLAKMVKAHFQHNNDFTFVTRHVNSAYTSVSRDSLGNVIGVVETREQKTLAPQAGERDIGLFIFRKTLVLNLLKEGLPSKWGKFTGEHGFLYVIEHLVTRGFCVEAMPIALDMELISLNTLNDIEPYI